MSDKVQFTLYGIGMMLVSFGLTFFALPHVEASFQKDLAFRSDVALPDKSMFPKPIVASEKQEKKRAPDFEQTTLLALGDIMLGRHVESLMGEFGISYPFERVGSVLKGSDLVLGNLEGTIGSKHVHTPVNSLRFSFLTSTAKLLADNNITLVSRANNHSFDYGPAVFDETSAFLDAQDIKSIGHYNRVQLSDNVALSHNDSQFQFFGFNDTMPRFDKTAAVNLIQSHASTSTIDVVTIHWGSEYEQLSHDGQKAFAHALVDAGADVIIGHHPHVVQEVEVYNRKPIFYSLGNFIFDQYFSQQTQEGLMVKMTVKEKTIIYDLIPYDSVQAQPRLMGPERKKLWLHSFAERSDPEFIGDIRIGRFILPR